MAELFPDITPDAKVGAILDAYPGLEPHLLTLSPAYAKLRNPILRATIGKVASLRQVAEIGGVPLGTLINTQRRHAGLAPMTAIASDGAAGPELAPAWFNIARVAMVYDARDDLARGSHPADRVLRDLGTLPADDIYLLITPFKPTPLLDIAGKKGYATWSMERDGEEVRNYFKKLTIDS